MGRWGLSSKQWVSCVCMCVCMLGVCVCVCCRYFDMLVVDGVFYFSNGKIKVANKTYSSIPSDYEITFDGNAIIR